MKCDEETTNEATYKDLAVLSIEITGMQKDLQERKQRHEVLLTGESVTENLILRKRLYLNSFENINLDLDSSLLYQTITESKSAVFISKQYKQGNTEELMQDIISKPNLISLD